jgi:hypothetical protein
MAKVSNLELTARQIDLARHALGLPNKRKKSFRNRFVADADHSDYDEWMTMVAMGAAKRVDASRVPFGGDDLFYLTMPGAHAARKRGEVLCLEDFPREPNSIHPSTASSGRMIERAPGAE